MLTLQVRVILGVMELPRSPKVESHHQIQFNDINRSPLFFREGSCSAKDDTVSIFHALPTGWIIG